MAELRDTLRSKELELGQLEALAETKASVGAPDADSLRATAKASRTELYRAMQEVRSGSWPAAVLDWTGGGG